MATLPYHHLVLTREHEMLVSALSGPGIPIVGGYTYLCEVNTGSLPATTYDIGWAAAVGFGVGVPRLSGVGVERFSIGFGPVLWRFKGPETEYCLSAVPMGGYVKMMGDDENPLEGGGTGAVDPRRAFHLKPLAVRFLIVFAGPGMNLVLAAVIFTLVFMIVGRPMLPTTLGRITDDGPAARAGLATGERVTAVDGRPVQYWDELLTAVQGSRGRPLRVSVDGGGTWRAAGAVSGRTDTSR